MLFASCLNQALQLDCLHRCILTASCKQSFNRKDRAWWNESSVSCCHRLFVSFPPPNRSCTLCQFIPRSGLIRWFRLPSFRERQILLHWLKKRSPWIARFDSKSQQHGQWFSSFFCLLQSSFSPSCTQVCSIRNNAVFSDPYDALLVFLRHVSRKWHRYYIWDSNWKKLLIGILLSLGYFIYLLSLSISTARSMFLFSLHSFVSLFALLSALFITCTGLPVIKLPSISIRGSTSTRTLLYLVVKNVLFLAGGTLLCNFIGTLAASVLLFPSFISQNASRLDHIPTQRYLIIFFIVLVGNCGGVLSPLGDPPLYMGYSNGVRFLFTFEHLYKIFLVVNGYTLLVFALIDLTNALLKRRDQRQWEAIANERELHAKLDAPVNANEQAETSEQCPTLQNDSRYDLSPLTSSATTGSWHGLHHLPFLATVIVLVVLKGLNLPRAWPLYLQEALLLGITLLCLTVDMLYNRLTPAAWYTRNYATRMEPVVEVLVIFVGLLFTMSAPIAVLTNMHIDIGPKVSSRKMISRLVSCLPLASLLYLRRLLCTPGQCCCLHQLCCKCCRPIQHHYRPNGHRWEWIHCWFSLRAFQRASRRCHCGHSRPFRRLGADGRMYIDRQCPKYCRGIHGYTIHVSYWSEQHPAHRKNWISSTDVSRDGYLDTDFSLCCFSNAGIIIFNGNESDLVLIVCYGDKIKMPCCPRATSIQLKVLSNVSVK